MSEEAFALLESGGGFCVPVFFKVASLQDSVDIKVDGVIKRARSISNCPYQIETLIKDQGLDYVFGSRRARKRLNSILVQENPKRRKFRQY
jgi:hypothetical protein